MRDAGCVHWHRVAHLEGPLQLAQRLFQGAQRGEQLVTVHEEDLGPQDRLARGEARGVARTGAEGGAWGGEPRQAVREQRRDDLWQVTRDRELAVVLAGGGPPPGGGQAGPPQTGRPPGPRP